MIVTPQLGKYTRTMPFEQFDRTQVQLKPLSDRYNKVDIEEAHVKPSDEVDPLSPMAQDIIGELAERLRPGLFPCQSGSFAFLDLGFQVESHFFLKFRFPCFSPQQPAELAPEASHHSPLSIGFNTRFIARENCSHFDVSALNCFLPAAVSR